MPDADKRWVRSRAKSPAPEFIKQVEKRSLAIHVNVVSYQSTVMNNDQVRGRQGMN